MSADSVLDTGLGRRSGGGRGWVGEHVVGRERRAHLVGLRQDRGDRALLRARLLTLFWLRRAVRGFHFYGKGGPQQSPNIHSLQRTRSSL